MSRRCLLCLLMKSLIQQTPRRWIQTQWISSSSLIISRPEQQLDDPKRVEQAFKESAKLGVVKTGVFEYFGSEQSRLSKLKEFDSVGLSLIVHSLGSLLKVCLIFLTLLEASFRLMH